MKRDFSHPPPRVERSAAGIWRASAIRRAIECSAVVTELPKGAFMTMTPRAVAPFRSILSTPIPARPTTRSLWAASRIRGVTFVAERTAIPSKSEMIPASSSCDSPTFVTHSIPRCPKRAAARGLIRSAIRTLATHHLPESPVEPGREFL